MVLLRRAHQLRVIIVDPPMSPFYFFFLFSLGVCVCLVLPQLVWCCVCIDACMLVVTLFLKRSESLFKERYPFSQIGLHVRRLIEVCMKLCPADLEPKKLISPENNTGLFS